MTSEIAKRADVEIDESVYDKVKLFRCPNTRHGESKLYKIPVSFAELSEEENANWIRQRAEKPRRLVENSVSGEDCVTWLPVTACVSEASELWRETVERLDEKEKDTDLPKKWKAQTQTLPHSGETFPRLRRDTLEFILDGVPEGVRCGFFKRRRIV